MSVCLSFTGWLAQIVLRATRRSAARYAGNGQMQQTG